MQKKIWLGIGLCVLVCIGVGVGLGVGLGMRSSSNNNNNNVQGSSAIQEEPGAVVTAIDGTPVGQGAIITTSYLTQAIRNGILDSHNSRRAKAGLANLSWDLGIEEFAYNYGQTLKSKSCAMTHSAWTGVRDSVPFGSGATAGKGVGENLAWSSGSMTFPSAAQMWWDGEVGKYYYGPIVGSNTNPKCDKPTSNDMVGHYTQMAWNATKFIGCAINNCGTQTIINCNYGPAGNWIGSLPFLSPSACTQGLKPQCQNTFVAGCTSLTGTSCNLCTPTSAPVSPPTPPTVTPQPTRTPTRSPALPTPFPAARPTAAPQPTTAPTKAPTTSTTSSCVSNSGATGCIIRTASCAASPVDVLLDCVGAVGYSGATVWYTLTMPSTYTYDFSAKCATCSNVRLA